MPARMDGGYINEGGQLKSKNGQKYVVNQKPDGYFLTKSCAILIGVATVIAMVLVFLITFFLLTQSCENAGHSMEAKNGTVAASFWPERTSAASTMTTSDGKTRTSSTGVTPDETSTTEGIKYTTIISSSGAPTARPIVIMDDIEAEEEIQESSKEMEALEEIYHHKGWIPIKYSLLLHPQAEVEATKGTVEILMESDPAERIIHPILLDINQIQIESVSISQIDDDLPVNVRFSQLVKNDGRLLELDLVMTDLKFSETVKLSVVIKFVSQITKTLNGIYKVDYKDDLGEKAESLISTQFSPIDARRAFPCIDQPDRKAVFEMSIVSPKDKTMVLSNMPVVSRHTEGETVVTKFAATPKMSTYLAAFIVSDLVASNHTAPAGQGQEGPEIKIWSRREVTDMTDHAYDFTHKALPLFEDYFDLKYKLPKLDLVAVPDFGYSGMENWGLITFRESALLVPKDKDRGSSAGHTERVTDILAHEIAHQWFGNLVTPKWWTDLWLKEGFSTYMSHMAMSRIFPDWRVEETFSIRAFHAAMSKDSDASSRKIYNPVANTADIRSLFDPITYSKGAILLRMMGDFLGEKAFKTAVRDYLKKFEYDNAAQDDLWALMTERGHQFETLSNHLSVKDIMDSWTLQPGYPVLFARKVNNSVVITQQRFIFPQGVANDSSRWYVPITYVTSNMDEGAVQKRWLTPDMKELVLEDVLLDNTWLYFNAKRMGYYRVHYDYDLTLLLSKSYQALPEVTRAQIIDDALHLARAELYEYDHPLTFLLRMGEQSKDVLSWMAASKGLEYLDYMLMRESAYDSYKTVMKHILRPAYDSIGFDERPSESHIELTQRSQIVKFACDFGYDRCTNRAQVLYREWMRTPDENKIKPNLKDIVYCVAMREGGLPEWKFAHKQYLQTTSASERETLLTAMGCTQKPWLLSKYLNMTLTPEFGITKQDGARAFAAVAKNMIGFELAFDFLSTHIQEISEYYGDGFQTLPKMIESLTAFTSKEYQLEQFSRLATKAKKLKLAGVEKSIRLATEQVKNNIYWRANAYYKLQAFLEKLMADFNLNY